MMQNLKGWLNILVWPLFRFGSLKNAAMTEFKRGLV
jgi:hypothetical protein